NALIRPQGRPAEDSISHIAPRDRIILRLKAQGLSNRGIAGRIGLDEKMIRKTLRRLGWRPAPEATLPLLPRADPPAPSAAVSESPADPPNSTSILPTTILKQSFVDGAQYLLLFLSQGDHTSESKAALGIA